MFPFIYRILSEAVDPQRPSQRERFLLDVVVARTISSITCCKNG
jgi:hypothetical protein